MLFLSFLYEVDILMLANVWTVDYDDLLSLLYFCAELFEVLVKRSLVVDFILTFWMLFMYKLRDLGFVKSQDNSIFPS